VGNRNGCNESLSKAEGNARQEGEYCWSTLKIRFENILMLSS